nr:mRNA-capping enzyme-like isoform X2 [Tanacetum cinerariifolium]
MLVTPKGFSMLAGDNRFSEARPPGIYKQDYLDDLCNFFGEQLPRTFVCPQTPEWKRSPDRDDDVDFGLQDNDFQASQMTNVVGKCDTINVVGAGEMTNAVGEEEMDNVKVPREMTSDDVLGDTMPLDKMESMRQFCNKVLNLNSLRPGVPPFPGSHLVSLSRIVSLQLITTLILCFDLIHCLKLPQLRAISTCLGQPKTLEGAVPLFHVEIRRNTIYDVNNMGWMLSD